MKKQTKFKSLMAGGVIVLAVLLTAGSCEGDTPTRDAQLESSQRSFDDRTPPQVTGDAEYQNYIKAQEEVYDDPASIIWCTVFPDTPGAVAFTVPVAGKLTSSSVSYYPNSRIADRGTEVDLLVEAQSVDGMYHGSPAPYRYGFTPGGQYVDFFNLATFCTTSLTDFQRQTLSLSVVDSEADQVQAEAEEALKAGDAAKAQELVDGLVEEPTP